MIPAFLNLLPLERRRSYDEHILFLSIRRFAISLGVFLLILTGVLFASTIFLEQKVTEQQKHTQEVEAQLSKLSGASLDQQIRDFNAILNKANTVQTSYIQWTPVLYDILSLIPKGVVLSDLEMDGKLKTISFSGTAATRDDLLALQNALSHSSRFSNLTSPISNLLQRENILFEMHATLSLP